MLHMHIRNLRSLRIARNQTLDAVAANVGVHPGRLSRIERGDPPSWKLANKLADYYGVTLDEAFNSKPEEGKKNVRDQECDCFRRLQGDRVG